MKTVKLRVKSDYRSQAAIYQAGTVIEVNEVEAAFLKRDAPDTFEDFKELKAEKAMSSPPADKQVKTPAKKK